VKDVIREIIAPATLAELAALALFIAFLAVYAALGSGA
jgi:hypothetical protein